jgi:hypothetical protein
MLEPNKPHNPSNAGPEYLGARRAKILRANAEDAPDLNVPASSSATATPLPPYVFDQPTVLSEGALFARNHALVQNYVSHWIRNPDKGSAFDRATRLIRWMPDTGLFALMRMMKYDGLVFTKPGEVLAHTFFQRHGHDLHMFSVSVADEYRGQGLAEKAILRFIEHARTLPDVDRIRLGAGGHPAVERVCEKFTERGHSLGLMPEPNRFFRFKLVVPETRD